MKRLPAMLALVPDAFGGRGGIAQYNRDFLSAAANSGSLSAITVLPRHAPDPSVTPPPIRQLRPRNGRVNYSVASLSVALSGRFDIVFCGHLFMAPLAFLVARLARAKLVLQTHGIEAWPNPPRHQRAAVESADLVLCVSRYTRATLLSWAAIEPNRVLVVSNTVRDVFTPGDASELRAAWGLRNKHVLLTVGRMDADQQYKGQDRLISVISALVARGFDICYLVVGSGSDRARLEALARDSSAGERVRFLGDIDLPELIETYRMVDLFVLPSTGEGFGIVFLEAMGCGTPVLGLGVAGATDALADGRLGAITQQAELADAIARLLAAPKADPETLSAAARRLFGRERFAESVRAALSRVLEAA